MSKGAKIEDAETLRRRLEKALSVGEKLKKKQVFESEVNKELAKRNEILKKEQVILEEKLAVIKTTILELDDNLNTIFERIEATDAQSSGELSPKKESTKKAEQKSLGNTKRTLHKLKLLVNINSSSSSVSSGGGLSSVLHSFPSMGVGGGTGGSTSGSSNGSSKKTRRQSSMFINLPELSGTSLLRKSSELVDGTMSLIRAKTSSGDATSASVSTAAGQGGLSTIDEHAIDRRKSTGNTHEDDADLALPEGAVENVGSGKKGPRPESMPAAVRTPAAMSQGGSKKAVGLGLADANAESIGLNDLDENVTTTSLLDMSTDSITTSTTTHAIASSSSSSVVASPAVVNKTELALLKLNSTNILYETPLFEHFLVVGAPPESATEFALQLLHNPNDDSISSRFMRTLGGFLSSNNSINSGGHNNNNSSSTNMGGVTHRESLGATITTPTATILTPSSGATMPANSSTNMNTSSASNFNGSSSSSSSISLSSTMSSFFNKDKQQQQVNREQDGSSSSTGSSTSTTTGTTRARSVSNGTTSSEATTATSSSSTTRSSSILAGNGGGAAAGSGSSSSSSRSMFNLFGRGRTSSTEQHVSSSEKAAVIITTTPVSSSSSSSAVVGLSSAKRNSSTQSLSSIAETAEVNFEESSKTNVTSDSGWGPNTLSTTQPPSAAAGAADTSSSSSSSSSSNSSSSNNPSIASSGPKGELLSFDDFVDQVVDTPEPSPAPAASNSSSDVAVPAPVPAASVSASAQKAKDKETKRDTESSEKIANAFSGFSRFGEKMLSKLQETGSAVTTPTGGASSTGSSNSSKGNGRSGGTFSTQHSPTVKSSKGGIAEQHLVVVDNDNDNDNDDASKRDHDVKTLEHSEHKGAATDKTNQVKRTSNTSMLSIFGRTFHSSSSSSSNEDPDNQVPGSPAPKAAAAAATASGAPTPSSAAKVHLPSSVAPSTVALSTAQPVNSTAVIAPSQIVKSDRRQGQASTEATILYRYPPEVDPPPQEVCDFCLPLGGKITRLSAKDEDTTVQEILYGHTHSKRSSRCFIFTLQDHTVEGEEDDEGGVTGRLYGICVIHPRLLKTPVVEKSEHGNNNNHNTNKSANGQEQLNNNNNNTSSSSSSSTPGGNHNNNIAPNFIEFESTVCYAFITRFPLFEFFFQVIFDLITNERLIRMEMAVDKSDSDLRYCRTIYKYLPRTDLEDCLERLTKLKPPKYGECINFCMCPSIQPIKKLRSPPHGDVPEHYINAAEWALPTLLSWMPVETIVWAISLLMSEAKIVVIGDEAGMVSCAVMGLLVLLRPLDWVAPLIPMLPTKLLDFIESPVPILAGLTVEPTLGIHSNSSSSKDVIDAAALLDRCSDTHEDGSILAVLDVQHRELTVASYNVELAMQCGIPQADDLCKRLQDCLSSMVTQPAHVNYKGISYDQASQQKQHQVSGGGTTPYQQRSTPQQTAGGRRIRPLYTVGDKQRDDSRRAQDLMSTHIAAVLSMAQELNEKIQTQSAHSISGAVAAVEEAGPPASSMQTAADEGEITSSKGGNRLSFGSLAKPKRGLNDEDDDDNDDDNDDDSVNGSADLLKAYYGSESPRSSALAADATTVLPRTGSTVSQSSTTDNKATQQKRRPSTSSVISTGTSTTIGAHHHPHSQPVRLTLENLQDLDSSDAFLNRFLDTQIFAEYVIRLEDTAAAVAATAASSSSSSSAAGALAAEAEVPSEAISDGGSSGDLVQALTKDEDIQAILPSISSNNASPSGTVVMAADVAIVSDLVPTDDRLTETDATQSSQRRRSSSSGGGNNNNNNNESGRRRSGIGLLQISADDHKLRVEYENDEEGSGSSTLDGTTGAAPAVRRRSHTNSISSM